MTTTTRLGITAATKLAERWPQLRAALTSPRAARHSEIRTGTPDGHAPLNVAALDLLRDGDQIAIDAAWLCTARTGTRFPSGIPTEGKWRWIAYDLATAPKNPAHAKTDPDGETITDLLARLLARVDTHLGTDTHPQHLDDACPICERRSLIGDPTTGRWFCTYPRCTDPATGRPYRSHTTATRGTHA